MTVLENKKIIKNIIDKMPDANLDETLMAVKNEMRKKILLDLLKNEQTLFEKLAQ